LGSTYTAPHHIALEKWEDLGLITTRLATLFFIMLATYPSNLFAIGQKIVGFLLSLHRNCRFVKPLQTLEEKEILKR
jgi:hypothetical protein